MPLPPRPDPNKPPGGFLERNWIWIAMIMAMGAVGIMGSAGQLGIAQAKRQMAAARWSPAPSKGKVGGMAVDGNGYLLAVTIEDEATPIDPAAFAGASAVALDAKQGAEIAVGGKQVGLAMISGIPSSGFDVKDTAEGGYSFSTPQRLDPNGLSPRTLTLFLVSSTEGLFDAIETKALDKQGVPIRSDAKTYWDGRLLMLGLTGVLPADLSHIELKPKAPAPAP